MESENQHPSPYSAAEQLRNYEDLRDRVTIQAPSRALSLLVLWGAVLIAAYMGVFLFSFAGHPVDGVGAGGYSYTAILLFPVLVFSSLVSGARERFGIRTKPASRYWIAYGLIIAAFMALAGLNVAGVSYPWGLNLLVAAALFVTMAAGPLRQLKGATTPDADRWKNEPLSRPARWSTGLIGVAAGLLVGTSTFPLVFSTVGAAVMLALVVMLLSWRAQWGLPRTGYEWGPIHWSAFGIAVSLLFLLTVLLSRTGWITTPISISAGVLVFLVMLIASALPARSRRR